MVSFGIFVGVIRLTTLAKDLCLFSQLFELPEHAPYFNKRLRQYPDLFENGDFGPTDEKGVAEEYQNSASRDFVAVVGADTSEMLINLFANNVDWIEKHILHRVRKWFGRSSQQRDEERGVELATIIKTIDALTCLFVPLLFTATMFALALTRQLMIRIAVVGAFGLAFTMSAKLIYNRMSRGEIFAFTAAFFAVASVFVSTTENNVSKSS
jgi:hypothetical protein